MSWHHPHQKSLEAIIGVYFDGRVRSKIGHLGNININIMGKWAFRWVQVHD